jgi:hypothetical protein
MPLSARITGRLATLASLGIAGLLAGFLSGCATSSGQAVNSPATVTIYTWEFTNATTANASRISPLLSVDAKQIPPIHHPPSTRRLHDGSVSTFNPAPVGNVPRRS